jgi:hypothetical protein
MLKHQQNDFLSFKKNFRNFGKEPLYDMFITRWEFLSFASFKSMVGIFGMTPQGSNHDR